MTGFDRFSSWPAVVLSEAKIAILDRKNVTIGSKHQNCTNQVQIGLRGWPRSHERWASKDLLARALGRCFNGHIGDARCAPLAAGRAAGSNVNICQQARGSLRLEPGLDTNIYQQVGRPWKARLEVRFCQVLRVQRPIPLYGVGDVPIWPTVELMDKSIFRPRLGCRGLESEECFRVRFPAGERFSQPTRLTAVRHAPTWWACSKRPSR